MGGIPRRYSYEYNFTVRCRYGKVGFGLVVIHGDVEKILRTIRKMKKKGRRTAACGALEARHLDMSSPAKPHSNSSHRILEGIHGIYFDVAEAHRGSRSTITEDVGVYSEGAFR